MMEVSTRPKIQWEKLPLGQRKKWWTSLWFTVSVIILIELISNLWGKITPIAFLWLGSAVAWSAYRDGLRIGLLNGVITSAYLTYLSLFILPIESWAQKITIAISGITCMFLLASLLGRQQEQTAKITQQFERVHQEMEEQVKESGDLLCIANEFLQQEIGDRVCAEDALVVSETRLRLLMEAIPLLICYVDAKQLYMFGNQQYELLVSKYTLNLEGKHLRDVLGKSNYEQMRLGIETALSGERVIDQQIFTIQQGKTVEVHLNLIPHFGSNMQVLGFFTLAQDLTEYKLAQLN